MSATILFGRPAANSIYSQLSHRLASLSQPPHLAIIQIGDNPESTAYINLKRRHAHRLGIQLTHAHLDNKTTTAQLLGLINQLNDDATVNAILVQLPLPPHINTDLILQSVHPAKDVDGLSPQNLGNLFAGQPSLTPATANGVLALLKHYHIPIAGRMATVVGRSRLVGLPLAHLLLHHQATVTIAHRHTTSLATTTRSADIVIVAVGHPNLITPDMVKPGATVIDVGITKAKHGLVGDVHPEVAAIAGELSPVPGGVGPLTVACLMQNIIKATEQQVATL